MRTVGHRKDHPITFSASSALLAEGARFNDEIHRLPTGGRIFIRKGVYRFKSFDDANRHDLECVAAAMAQSTRDRS
jgi:hypothetical protein